ncbi:ABC transporter substrate-binding protein [Novosphingobium profundi]|nr:ABC transporter substrate-binding protein [Novosphingobium profundi]
MLVAAGLVAAAAQSAAARPADTITYLLPAPKEAIVFAPFVLAQIQGKYRAANLDVHFVVVPGGFNVGKALARGEGDLGGASGDTPILLRAADAPVKGIALLGAHSFLTLVTRKDRVADDGTLSGKRIDVPSFKDTSYYALQEIEGGYPQGALPIQSEARSSADLIAALGEGKIDGFVGTVDWGVKAERAGAQLAYRELDDFYPAMAQAIIASDHAIDTKSKALKRFVRATLAQLGRIARDPEGSATLYERAVPDSGYSHAEVVRIFRLLGREVYGDTRRPGKFDRKVVVQAEAELLERGLIAQRRPAADYYTNRFAGG